MPTPITLTAADGSEADLLADIILTPEGGGMFGLKIGLSLGAVRPPAGPPTPPTPPPGVVPAAAAHWKFDSNRNDASGNGRHLTGGAATYAAGKYGQCIKSNSSYTGAAVLPGGAGAAYTLAGWFQRPAGGNLAGDISLQNGSGQSVAMVAGTANFVPGSGFVNQFVFTVGSAAQVVTPADVADGWHHLALVVYQGWASGYVDGTLAVTFDVSAEAVTDDAATVVGSVGGQGLDDAVAVAGALTAANVAAVYAAAGDYATVVGS